MDTGQIIVAHHDPGLVALSIFVSILAAYAARALIDRLRDAGGRTWTWLAWLAVGATVDGIGTWSMHYTGKMALRLPVPVLFDWPTVVLSLLVSITGSGAALLVVGRGKIGWPRAVAAGVLLGGVGISGLHYTAMAAMRTPGMHHHYSFSLVTLSVVLAIVISLLAVVMALVMAFLFPGDSTGGRWRRHASAWLRGSANPVMHYTAMAALTFTYTGEVQDLSRAVNVFSLGVLGVSIVPVMVLVVALLTSVVDRLRKQRTLLDELFEQAPQAVVLMSADATVVRVNREFTRVFGYGAKEAQGRRLGELIVPDEARHEVQKYLDMLARGQRVDAEGVRQRKDASRLYVSIVHVPVTLPGGQIEAYAIYRDITELKRAEEHLRATSEQLRALSASLESAREEEGTRIAREIHDELGAALSSLRWDLEEVNEVISESAEPSQLAALREKISAMLRLTDATVNTVRRIASELRPLALDDLGLVEAIEWQARQFQERTGIIFNCVCPRDNLDLSREQSTAVFRIFQEALTNVLRHARADRVDITMKEEDGELVLKISDNGRGITEEEKSGQRTLGLLGMRERAHLAGGKVEITGVEGEGTVLTVRIPISG
ncbi:MAG TPA: MHYT domain-containing protein [Pyrinomonadaceae bacterium]|jgi:PAS domain S-box-containing protein|nr:MHYT domain-containing protein [Pyrinomonadaceae bacterium]